MLERLVEGYCRLLVALMAVALMAMVVLVLGNVVLRYAFNSSIVVSEEISRWLFVYITFMGAVVALKENAHLGTDVLVARLGPAGKKACLVAGHALMLYVCWLIFRGSLEQTQINLEVLAPSTQLPLAIVYASGLLFSVSGALMLVRNLWRLVTGRVAEDELVMVQESEDLARLDAHGPGGTADPAERTPR